MDRFVNEVFKTPNHLLDTIEKRPYNKCWVNREKESDQHGDWGKVRSLVEALEKSREGYLEVTDQMKDTFEAAKKYVYQRVEPKHAMPINAYVGSTPNITRAILGLPKDMRKVDVKQKKVPGIHLVYEAGLNCRYTDDQLVEYGARMLALVSLCIRQQIPVRLSVTDTMTGLLSGGGYLSFEIGVKDYSDAANIRKIAYWLAHPSMHRRIMFKWLETTPLVERYMSGYGYPIANEASECDEVCQIYAQQGAFWFSPRDFKSDDDIMKAWERISGADGWVR